MSRPTACQTFTSGSACCIAALETLAAGFETLSLGEPWRRACRFMESETEGATLAQDHEQPLGDDPVTWEDCEQSGNVDQMMNRRGFAYQDLMSRSTCDYGF